MAAAVAAAAAKAQRDVVSHFLSRNAVTPQAAASFDPPRRLQRRAFERLTRAEVLKPGDNGGWYLDAPVWDSYSRRRRHIALGMAGGAAIVGALLAVLAAS